MVERAIRGKQCERHTRWREAISETRSQRSSRGDEHSGTRLARRSRPTAAEKACWVRTKRPYHAQLESAKAGILRALLGRIASRQLLRTKLVYKTSPAAEAPREGHFQLLMDITGHHATSQGGLPGEFHRHAHSVPRGFSRSKWLGAVLFQRAACSKTGGVVDRAHRLSRPSSSALANWPGGPRVTDGASTLFLF